MTNKTKIKLPVAHCVQCGNEDDLMLLFTKDRVCSKCVKKNHRKAVSR